MYFVLTVDLGQAQTKGELTDFFQAEVSQFRRTGAYAEVEATCQSLAKKYPDAVRCFSFGQTAEGRPIYALAVSRSGALTPAQARRAGLPVVLAIGGTHAGEIDGKDAGLILIRDMLRKIRRLIHLSSKSFYLFRFLMWTDMSGQVLTTDLIKMGRVCRGSA